MNKQPNGFTLIFIFCVVMMIILAAIEGVSLIFMDKNCLGYLKRSGDANTIAVAHRELTTAITYLEKHGLTTGYTSVVYQTPDEDIGFWYENLKAAQLELSSVKNNPKSTSLERSNVLMKLRETLLDKKSGSDKLTYPEGIAWYPYNATLALGFILFLLAGVVSFILSEFVNDQR